MFLHQNSHFNRGIKVRGRGRWKWCSVFERLAASSLIEVHTRRHKPAWFSRAHLYFKVFGKDQHGSNAYNHWSLWTNFYSNRHREIFVLSIVCYFILFLILLYLYQYITCIPAGFCCCCCLYLCLLFTIWHLLLLC